MIRPLLLLALVVGVVWLMRKVLRFGAAVRAAADAQLALEGRWRGEAGQVQVVLELSGGPREGAYVRRAFERGSARSERGRWRLVRGAGGGELALQADDGHVQRLTLARTPDGQIGLRGGAGRGVLLRREAGATLQQVG